MDSAAIPTPITQITPVTPVTPIIPIFKKINDIYVKSSYLEKNFENGNPFLHLSLHLALQEQIQTNRPEGIQAVYLKLIKKHLDSHQVEHAMMEVLEYILWEAQKNNQMPDEKVYLDACEKLAEY